VILNLCHFYYTIWSSDG